MSRGRNRIQRSNFNPGDGATVYVRDKRRFLITAGDPRNRQLLGDQEFIGILSAQPFGPVLDLSHNIRISRHLGGYIHRRHHQRVQHSPHINAQIAVKAFDGRDAFRLILCKTDGQHPFQSVDARTQPWVVFGVLHSSQGGKVAFICIPFDGDQRCSTRRRIWIVQLEPNECCANQTANAAVGFKLFEAFVFELPQFGAIRKIKPTYGARSISSA